MLNKDQLQFCCYHYLKFMLFTVQNKPQHDKIMVFQQIKIRLQRVNQLAANVKP